MLYIFGITDLVIPGLTIRLKLEWESLEQRRAKWRLINFYKMTHNMLSLTSPFLIQLTSPFQAHAINFQRHNCATNYLKFSYFPRTIA